MIAKSLLLLFFISQVAFGVDLGAFGKTYLIKELPADKLIAQRLQFLSSQQKRALEKHFLDKVKASVIRPSGFFLPRATKHTKRWFNPAIHFPEDVLDSQGNVIIVKNSIVNPLNYVSLNKPLVFFDGDDAVQATWVRTNHLDSTLILIKGEPLVLQKAWDRNVFFDQGGKLRQHFSLKALPSVITQDKKQLRIEECDPS